MIRDTRLLCLVSKKRINLFFSLVILFFSVQLQAQYEQVVINEVSGDGGNIEARNDAIVELAGPPGTDIGCMVITNTEWAVVLPSGATIPSDGVFLIACAVGNNGGGSVYVNNQSGLSCTSCDFPSLIVDFDVCDPANINYISSSLFTNYGFTLDNGYCGSNRDGDQVLLFQPDGTPHDAVYWGQEDMTDSNNGGLTYGGASGNCGSAADHVSVQIGQAYTLGDNDDNNIVNDYLGTHVGFKGDGGNATGVNKMPSGNDDLATPVLFGSILGMPPGDCNADQKIYTVPSLQHPIWVNVGLALVGCNSTHIRLNDSSPMGNSEQKKRPFTTASHMDDPDLNLDWVAYSATDLMPSSIDPMIAAQQWQVTNHPNPSVPNDSDTWDFFYDIGEGEIEITEKDQLDLTLCESQTIRFGARIYNYQHVEPNISTNHKAGSFIRDEQGIDQAWNIDQLGSNNNGITELSFTTNLLQAGIQNSFTLVWDDYTDCCGSASANTVVNTNNPNECYERLKVNVTVVEPIDVTTTSINCPEDFEVGIGIIDVSSFVTNPNTTINYQLKEGVTIGQEMTSGMIVIESTTGILQLPTSLIPPIAIILEDQSNCSPSHIIHIGADCRKTLACPDIKGATINTQTICPNTIFDLTADGILSKDLPAGSQILWHYGIDPNFDPLDQSSDGYLGVLPNNSTITNTGTDCPSDGANIFISELSDPMIGWECHRYIEIYNGGPCPKDLFGWTLEAIGNDMSIATFHLNGTINVGQAMTASADCATSFVPDFVLPNSQNWKGGSLGFFNGQSKDGARLYDDMGNLVDAAVINNLDNNDWFMDGVAIRRPTICEGFVGSNMLCETMATCNHLTNNWEGSLGDNLATPQVHSIAEAACPEVTNTFAISKASNQLDNSFCNQTVYIKGVLNPMVINESDCNTANNITSTLSIDIECPEGMIASKDINLCQPIEEDEVLIQVDLKGGSGIYDATLSLTINGGITTINGSNLTSNWQLTYSDIVQAIGTTTFSDVEVAIGNIVDAAGSLCTGQYSQNIVYLTVQETPIATITNSTAITDCMEESDGSVTFEMSPENSGPWDLEYSIDGGPSKSISTNTTPFVLSAAQAGIYELLSVVSNAGCKGQIGQPNNQEVKQPSDPLEIISVEELSICDDGATTVNLNTDILIEIASNESLLSGTAEEIGNIEWYTEDPYGLPPLLQSGLLSEELVSPIVTTNYYFIYTREDGCIAYGKATILVNQENCIEPEPENIIIPTLSQWGLLIFTLLILNISLWLIGRVELITRSIP